MASRLSKMMVAVALVFACAGASAKLPPPTEEAKAKAEEAKAKAAEGAKKAAEDLGRVQDRVAERYMKSRGASPSAGAPVAGSRPATK